MKRVLVTAVSILVLVAGATVAEAAIKQGMFTGKSTAKDPMGLKVSASHRVYSFYFEGVRLECTDGDAFDLPSGARRPQTPAKVTFPIRSNGKWNIKASNKQTGFGWQAAGQFLSNGATTTGTLKVHASFNDQNEETPNGSIKCTSKNLGFTLKRR